MFTSLDLVAPLVERSNFHITNNYNLYFLVSSPITFHRGCYYSVVVSILCC